MVGGIAILKKSSLLIVAVLVENHTYGNACYSQCLKKIMWIGFCGCEREREKKMVLPRSLGINVSAETGNDFKIKKKIPSFLSVR